MQEAFIQSIDNGQLFHAYLFEGQREWKSGDGQGNRKDAELYEANKKASLACGEQTLHSY